MTEISQPFVTVGIESATAGSSQSSLSSGNNIIPPSNGGPKVEGITKFLMNFENGIGTQPANDDTGFRTLTWNNQFNGNPNIGTPQALIVASPKFGTGAYGSLQPVSNVTNNTYLDTELTTNLDLSGQVDFCIQYWYNPEAMNTQPGGNASVSIRDQDNQNTIGIEAVRDTDTTYHFEIVLFDGGFFTIAGTTIFNVGTYVEVALSSINNFYTVRINGVTEITNDFIARNFASKPYKVRLQYQEGNGGSVDSARVVHGCGVFNADYTPGVVPLTEITVCPI